MTALQVSHARQSSAVQYPRPWTVGVGSVSREVQELLKGVGKATPGTSIPTRAPKHESLDEKLYDALALFKVRTATVAMHIDREWRDRLFRQLDSLLSVEDWEADDKPPALASFSTFIRMLLFLSPEKRPGLGATSDGHLIAAWTEGNDRLTIECLPNDIVRWHLSAVIDGERERAAACTPIQRLNAVLAPYSPMRWFNYGNQIS